MSTWKEKTPRVKRMAISYLVISIPLMVAAMLGAALAYGRISGIGPDDPLSFPHLLGFMTVILIACVLGLAAGGGLWLPFARFVFGFSRSDIEEELARQPRGPVVSRYNAWCLDVVFGAAPKSEKHPAER
ncbi:MAG: hypothetical protein BWY59_01230 [Verrucomicrobia bacterium ADurb.Bin345]|nr:MAG: hypothetical protein BWY59_01230 [Verrucomicrobia bacterium ADurb.Bin345]